MQRLIINTVFTRASSTALNFLVAIMITRTLGTADKGSATLIATTVSFMLFFSSILGGQALVYLVPRANVYRLLLPAYLWTLLVTLVGFLILPKLGLVPSYFVKPIMILSALSSLLSTNQLILLGMQRLRQFNLLTILPLLLLTFMLLSFFYLASQHSLSIYIRLSYAAYFLSLLFSVYLLFRELRGTEWRELLSLEEFVRSLMTGLQFQLADFLQFINLRFYLYYLHLQSGMDYLGMYSIGLSVLESVWIISRSAYTVHYSGTSNTDSVTEGADKTLKLLRFSMLLSAPALILIACVPSSIYAAVFGPVFVHLKYSMRFLFPGILIYNTVIVISTYYFGQGKYALPILSHLAGSLAIIGLSTYLIPSYVMSGAGLAATLSFAVAAGVMLTGFMWKHRIPLAKLLPGKDDLQFINTIAKSYLPAVREN